MGLQDWHSFVRVSNDCFNSAHSLQMNTQTKDASPFFGCYVIYYYVFLYLFDISLKFDLWTHESHVLQS